MLSRDELISRGQTVADFLSRPWVQDVFEEIEQEITKRWQSEATAEGREAAHAEYRGLVALQRKFQSYVDGGNRAASEIERAEKREREI